MSERLEMHGNAALLELPGKLAFLSSRKVAPQDVMRCYDWATEVRDGERCIMGGFQSALEKDVLRFLLRGKAPLILVLARSLWRKIPEELCGPINEGRLLVVSPVGAARASASSAAIRNRWILANCSEVVFGSLDPHGALARLPVSIPSTILASYCGGQDNDSMSRTKFAKSTKLIFPFNLKSS